MDPKTTKSVRKRMQNGVKQQKNPDVRITCQKNSNYKNRYGKHN